MLKTRIIAFEGIDNSGKTTQCHKLEKRLNTHGLGCTLLESNFKIYQLIKDYFQTERFSPYLKTLLFATELFDRWYSQTMLNEIVIFDRYMDSLFAYGLLDKLDNNWIKNILAPLPRADLVIYIDIPPEVYLERAGNRVEYFSPYTIDQLRIVRIHYQKLVKKYDYLFVDGTQNECTIEKLIYNRVSSFLKLKNCLH